MLAGQDIDYDVTITNNGYSPIDLTELDGSGVNPFASSLFNDILPADLTLVGSNTTNVTCGSYGPGSASFAPFLTNHATAALVFCSYAGPSHILDTGDSYTASIKAHVADGSTLDFTNYVISGLVSIEADGAAVTNSYGTADAIDTLVADNINNLASVTPPTDLSISNTVVDANTPNSGTVTYDVTVTNNSGPAVQLTDFDASAGFATNHFFFDFLSPELTYTGSTGDITCVGPLSASAFGPAAANHSDYSLVECNYSGPSRLLAAGESISFTVSASVSQPTPASFKSYTTLSAFGPGGYSDIRNDPDSQAWLAIFGGEIIDGVEAATDGFNDYARAVWPAPVNGGGGADEPHSSTSSSSASSSRGTTSKASVASSDTESVAAADTTEISSSNEPTVLNNGVANKPAVTKKNQSGVLLWIGVLLLLGLLLWWWLIAKRRRRDEDENA